MKTFKMLFVISLIFIVANSTLAQKHEKITPLLVNLSGWEGDDAEGVSMDVPGMKMIQASRNYEKGDLELHATFIAGGTMITQAQSGGISLDSDDVKMDLTKIDGFKVNRYTHKEDDMTAIIIFIHESDDNSAILNLTAEGGVNEDDLLKLAKEFDWKEMKSVIKKLL